MRLAVTCLLLTTLFCAGALWTTDLLAARFSGADESAHVVNALAIREYLLKGLGSPPVEFAANLYLHYPKISIGHWPPGYYAALALFLIAAPTAFGSVVLFNSAVSIALPIATALSVRRHVSPAIAVAAAAIMASTSMWLESIAFIMLDQAVVLICFAGTLAWIRLFRSPSWSLALAFSACCAGAAFVKGNGLLLFLVPALFSLVTGRFAGLFSVKVITGCALAFAAVVPWYALTSKISADGFNYTLGIQYATLSVLHNIKAILRNLGPISLFLAGFGFVVSFRRRHMATKCWDLAAGMASLVAATFLFQALIPADLADRYVAPALPAVVVLSALSIDIVYNEVLKRSARRWPSTLLMLAIIATMVAPGANYLLTRDRKVDLRMDLVADLVSGMPGPAIWLVDGGPGDEGAFIAEMALRDAASKGHYVARASKLLATSDFMGRNYGAKYKSQEDVLAALGELGIKGVVTVRRSNDPALLHNRLLDAMLTSSESPFSLKAEENFRNRAGVARFYVIPKDVTPNLSLHRQQSMPSKAGPLSGKVGSP